MCEGQWAFLPPCGVPVLDKPAVPMLGVCFWAEANNEAVSAGHPVLALWTLLLEFLFKTHCLFLTSGTLCLLDLWNISLVPGFEPMTPLF